jgi:hypothetical protein
VERPGATKPWNPPWRSCARMATLTPITR